MLLRNPVATVFWLNSDRTTALATSVCRGERRRSLARGYTDVTGVCAGACAIAFVAACTCARGAIGCCGATGASPKLGFGIGIA